MVSYVWEGTLWWVGGGVVPLAPPPPNSSLCSALIRNWKWVRFRDPYGNPTGKIPCGFQQDHSFPITAESLLPNSSPVYDWPLGEDPSLASEDRELSPVQAVGD